VVFAFAQRFGSVVKAARHSLSAVEIANSSSVQHSVFAVEGPHVDQIAVAGLAMVGLEIEIDAEKRE
jgi:hypothetical protein